MHIGKRAIVIGAGMGGLSVARALVGSFDEILVIERDVLTPAIASRPGIPQGRHPHALLPGGARALSELFDNFPAMLRGAGAKVTDYGKRMRFEFSGQDALPEREVGIEIHSCTRPLVETVVRRCVEGDEDILIFDGRRVIGLISSGDDGAVDNVWGLAALPDLTYPDARGHRPQDLDEALAYQRQVAEAALLDHGIHKLLLEVIGLITPADALRTPDVVDKVRSLSGKSALLRKPGSVAQAQL